MLDQETKKIIDSARDILVGKLPAPNTQVDQITLAMLYKFMDDIDQEVIEFGGNAKYFANDFKKYSWREIMRNSVGAQERMNLYIEALAKFSSNDQLPETFKEIFKNATVPYREPEILTMFLKEIGKLEYLGDSEKLGDGYEYLLSILGSQGGLGQFRTPRHIIDFIVEIVDPLKTDKVLDPACGTAGFLISAYKHIVKKEEYEQLTYDEKNRILSNITGYDIEPSMVRIAKMNMYLHGCISPDITEYDSLTMDDYWSEKFDVILANPPFMTPKGGISPHNRFQVKAKRTEVLFVDYILEHLRLDGRAGIIVPDSVLFNPSSKFETVRRMLLDNNVYAVVSLPTGVFLPYSEVKTSILFVDKSIAKRAGSVLFIDVLSDGFKLSMSRKEKDDSDLVFAQEVIKDFKNAILSDKKFVVPEHDLDLVKIVKKEMISEDKCYLLSKKYKFVDYSDKKYDFTPLKGKLIESKERVKEQSIEVWSVSNREGFVRNEGYFNDRVASDNISNYKIVKPGYFAYNPARINVGSIAYNDTNLTGCVSPMYTVFSVKDINVLDPKYLFALLKSPHFIKEFSDGAYGSVRQQLRFNDLLDMCIPNPSVEKINEMLLSISRLEEKQQELDMIENEISSKIDDLFS